MAEAAPSGDPAEARGFEALGDANRREILRILSGGDKPVREIADAMTISRPAVSRHLRLLKDAGMVAEQAREHAGSTLCRSAGSKRSMSTCSASGARRPPVSGCWPRTPGPDKAGPDRRGAGS